MIELAALVFLLITIRFWLPIAIALGGIGLLIVVIIIILGLII